MMHCTGQGFRLESLDLQQALKANNGKLNGRVSAGGHTEKPIIWNVTFTGDALKLVLDLAAGSLIDIVHGVIAVRGGSANNNAAYNLVIDKAEVFKGAQAPDYAGLSAYANNMRVLRKHDVTDGKAWRIILGADEPERPAGAEPVKWYSFFVNAAFGQAQDIKADDLININNAEITHAYSNKNGCYQVYLTVLLFSKAAPAKDNEKAGGPNGEDNKAAAAASPRLQQPAAMPDTRGTPQDGGGHNDGVRASENNGIRASEGDNRAARAAKEPETPIAETAAADSFAPDYTDTGATKLYGEPLKLYTLTTKRTAKENEVKTPAPQRLNKPEAELYNPPDEAPKLYKLTARSKTQPADETENIVQTTALSQPPDRPADDNQPIKLFKLTAKTEPDSKPAAANAPVTQFNGNEAADADIRGLTPGAQPLKLYKITGKKAENIKNEPLNDRIKYNTYQKSEINSGSAADDIDDGDEPAQTDDSGDPGKPDDGGGELNEPKRGKKGLPMLLREKTAFFKFKKRKPAAKKKGETGAADAGAEDGDEPPETGARKITNPAFPNIFKPKRQSKTKKCGAGAKAKKQNRPANKYEKNITKLQPKITAIEEKRRENAYYVQTKRERKLMKRWQTLRLAKRKEDIRIGKRRISKKNSKLKHRRRATAIPRTTQQSIPYVTDYEEGLFEVEPNKFSKTYIMQDINYLVAQEDEQRNIFEKYGQFLNYFNDDMNIAITIDNHVVSMSEQERKIFYADKGDDYDIHRHEYNAILRQQLMSGRNDIKITKYVTVTIDCDTPYEALLRFHKIDAEVITNLRRIGSDGKMLTTDERLAMLHDKFRRGHEGEFNVNFDFLKEQGLSSKDYIAPTSFRFERSHFMIDDEYFRCMYVSNLPNSLVDTFLSELVDVEFPLVTTINIQPLAQSKALRLIRKQLTGMESNKIESEKRALRSGYSPDMISHDLKQSLSQAEKLLDDVQNNDQKMFFVSITLMAAGATLDELEDHCKILESRARQKTCQLQAFAYQQENAFKCTLPLGAPTYNKIYVERALTTQATAVFIPFSAQELFQIGGFYYGLNQMSRNLILCDRTSMKTPSGFILGSSGSGKSFATKREQLNVLLQSDKTSVLVIDPENEYGDFARAFGGTRVNISMESSNFVNPMDMSADYGLDDEDDIDPESRKTKALQKKSDIIMSIIQSMIAVGKSNDTIITPQQKTIVDRAVRRAYRNYLLHDFDPEYLPTLLDLQEELDKERGTVDGQLMADGVEYYTKGSMNVFSHKTNVNYSGRFVVFNVKELGEQLKQIALLIILDFIWNRLMENFTAGVRTYCYVDEIHVLFQNEYSSRFLQQLYKRGRKYGLVMTGITQNMSDVLATEMSRSMIANSDFLLMLNQAPEDLKILSEMLNISETQMSFVNRADAGCGLLFAEKVIVPFVDHFPTKSYLYRLMSTKFGEDYTTETVEDIMSEAQREKAAESRYSLHNARVSNTAV